MEELSVAQAIVSGADSIGTAIVIAALIRGFLNK